MDLRDFAQFHLPALEADEVRFNLQIAVLTAAVKEARSGFSFWTLGGPGHCAIQSPGRAILLGNLDQSECQEFAWTVRHGDYPGVVGADQTPHWFVQQATALGAKFDDPIPQRIHALNCPPKYPGAEGMARAVGATDAPLLFDWLVAFHREAVPHDPPPEQANLEALAASGRFMFWTKDGWPVSIAAISRRLERTGAIAPVYTPPEHRGRGYAGSVTATLADRLFAEGKTSACLYTDLRNPMSNRCYAKIGFKPYCDSWHYLRLRPS
jgi:RimJ/RimL family protein N-acetyltransferase